MARAPTKVAVVSFNSGVVTPKLHARIDLTRASSSARALENMLIGKYGLVTRRPGFRFVAGVRPIPDPE